MSDEPAVQNVWRKDYHCPLQKSRRPLADNPLLVEGSMQRVIGLGGLEGHLSLAPSPPFSRKIGNSLNLEEFP